VALDIQKATPGEKAMSDTTPLTIDKSGEESDPPDTADASSAAEPASSTEIEFETVGSEHWNFVRQGAQLEASRRLQTRYDAVIEGVQWFRKDANELVKNAIKKPPEHLSGFGAIVESVMAACLLLVPEVGLAAEIAEEVKKACEKVKTAYEVVKPLAELAEKANQEVIVNSVEEATNYLQELTATYAEDVENEAGPVKQAAEKAVGAALDSYITQNPQPLKPGDDELCKSLCDAIGIKEPDLNAIKMEVWNEVFPPFKKQVAVIAAQIHFFQEMDTDPERLNFLMDEAEKGNDPDALLSLIGANQPYWDGFLTVFRSEGRLAAGLALEGHLMLHT
jgi:hypothetical protein